MSWMNEYDIDDAVARWSGFHPVLGPAAKTLYNLKQWTNRNSDGWPYWRKPANAAARLMELIQGDLPGSRFDAEREDATPEKLKAALRPVKAFRTRQGADFEIEGVA